jgi:hypothetical protein
MTELAFTLRILRFFPEDVSIPDGKDNLFTIVLSDPESNKTFPNALVFIYWIVPTAKLVDCSFNKILLKSLRFTSLTPRVIIITILRKNTDKLSTKDISIHFTLKSITCEFIQVMSDRFIKANMLLR